MDLQTLVDEFINSEEFKQRQREMAQPLLLELPEFKIYYRKNDFFIGAVLAKAGSIEPHVCDQIRRLLKPGDVFVDLGANIGYLTLLGSTLVGPKGQVHAFEPSSDNCKMIERSLVANGIKNVTLYPRAVADRNERIKLLFSGSSSNTTISDLPPNAIDELEPRQIVEAVTLDGALAHLEQIDLIKMDIEGAEPRAWIGMRQILEHHRPVIIFEFFPDLIRVTGREEPRDFLNTVMQSGYDLFIIKNEGGLTDTSKNPDQVISWHSKTGFTHIDLLAMPRT